MPIYEVAEARMVWTYYEVEASSIIQAEELVNAREANGEFEGSLCFECNEHFDLTHEVCKYEISNIQDYKDTVIKTIS